MSLSRRHVVNGGFAVACARDTLASPLPTPAVWLQRWLAAFNAPNATTYAQFVQRHIPTAAPYLDEDLGLREASGGFTLLRSEVNGERGIIGHLRDRNWDRVSKVILSVGDQGVDDLSFGSASSPPGFSIRRLRQSDAVDALRRKLRLEAGLGRFSGAVLIAPRGQVLLREAYGAIDPAGKQAARPATRFCIGSAGKMFTAVGVLQLIQSGRLQLTDTLAQLLPDHPETPLARSVTVRHLLTHSGGTGDFFGPEYEAHATELRAPSDFVRRFGAREALFPAGSRWGYSNFGFILLGAILEHVSDEPWDVYLTSHVFRPAGMTATSAEAKLEDTAAPLVGSNQTGLKALPYYRGLPAGGGYSTVDDLLRFGLALECGVLLDPARLQLLTAPSIPAGARQWSLGLTISGRNGAPFYGHAGSAPGVSADFSVYPASGYTSIVLSNRGHPHAANAAEFIGNRLPIGYVDHGLRG